MFYAGTISSVARREATITEKIIKPAAEHLSSLSKSVRRLPCLAQLSPLPVEGKTFDSPCFLQSTLADVVCVADDEADFEVGVPDTMRGEV